MVDKIVGLLLSLLFGVASATQRQLICESASEANGDSDDNTVYFRGPPGMKGAVGSKGFPGSVGLNGRDAVADYNLIYAKIQEKIDAAFNNTLSDLLQQINEIEERMLASLNTVNTTAAPATSTLSPSEIKIANYKAKGLCPVQYKDLCFWLNISKYQDYSWSYSQTTCQQNDGEVANVYSEQHMHDLMNLMREMSPKMFDSTRVWTALTVDPSTRRVRLSDDSPAPYTGWYASWYPERGQRRVMLYTVEDPKAPYQGMGGQTTNAYGVLCEV